MKTAFQLTLTEALNYYLIYLKKRKAMSEMLMNKDSKNFVS